MRVFDMKVEKEIGYEAVIRIENPFLWAFGSPFA